MNFVADEGIDAPIVSRLREEGHQVWYVAEMSPGVSDVEILALANRENCVLLTFDKDFGDLVFRQRRISPGVVLIRLHGFSPKQKADMVSAIIQRHATELPRTFTVITPHKVRIRPQFH
ncbi:MAG: hypothetical protein GY803_26500 [Chloroflexi bacterium]|nr:hypothetical protein [Chloroflexota bacterium]